MTTTATTIASGVKIQPVQLQPKPQKNQQQNQQHLRYPRAAGCGGDGCVSRDPRLLHHVRHRGVFCRLCTSCVLRYHPGSFCPNCFELFDATGNGSIRAPAVVHCASCPSVSHSSCIPENAADYVCPNCSNPKGFSYFPIDGDKAEGNEQTMDRKSSKVLLTAAQLASASMGRAVASAKIEAERKVKEAALAKKRAREMLERAISTAKREREKRTRVVEGVVMVAEQKRKLGAKTGSAVAAAVAAQKRIQNREREKWMKLSEPVPLAQKLPVHAVVENDRFKGSFVGSSPGNRTTSVNLGLPNHVKQEERDKTKGFSASQSGLIAGNEKVTPKVSAESNAHALVPASNQDAQIAKTSPRVISTGSPNAMSLHS